MISKTSAIFLASSVSLVLALSSCGKGAQTDTDEAPQAEAPQETILAEETETPAPAVEAVETVGSVEPIESAEMTILQSQAYYTDENLKISDEVIAAISPEINEQVLNLMRDKKKLDAVKLLRANSETSLAVTKLTVERMAIAEGISAGF
jgi:hypothetical protein